MTGSKFGGYGSFLPTYQRSPLPQTRSPPKAANVSSRSPYHQPTEVLKLVLTVNIQCFKIMF